jgi:hypothetical protein
LESGKFRIAWPFMKSVSVFSVACCVAVMVIATVALADSIPNGVSTGNISGCLERSGSDYTLIEDGTNRAFAIRESQVDLESHLGQRVFARNEEVSDWPAGSAVIAITGLSQLPGECRIGAGAATSGAAVLATGSSAGMASEASLSAGSFASSFIAANGATSPAATSAAVSPKSGFSNSLNGCANCANTPLQIAGVYGSQSGHTNPTPVPEEPAKTDAALAGAVLGMVVVGYKRKTSV